MIDLNRYYISSTFQGASGGSDGRSGYVPEALSADELKFLRGDGTWQDVIVSLGDIPNLSGVWNSTYTTVQSNSANWNTAFDRSTVFSNVSSRYDSSSTAVESNSANWNNAYNTGTVYQANSATYATSSYVDTNFLNLTGGTIFGDLTLLNNLFVNGSAIYVNTQDLIVSDPLIYIAEGNPDDSLDIGIMAAWVDPVSAGGVGYQHGGLVRRVDEKVWTLFKGATAEPLSGVNVDWYQAGIQLEPLSAKFYGDIYGDRYVFGSLSASGPVYGSNLNIANWDTAFNRSTVFSSVSGRYDSSSTVTESNSGNWNYAYDTAVSYSSISSTFATNSTVNSVSSLLTPLTLTNNLTSQLVRNVDFNLYKTDVASTTALLTPLTLTNNLTSQLVLNTDFNNYRTSVAAATATLLPTTVYQNASGNWQGTYTNVQSNSANWNTAFDRSTVFSSVSGRYDSSSTVVESNSANWNSTYTTVQSNSANWDNAYNTGTVYQSNSATYATNTLLQSISALLTPLTLTNNLTSQLVTNNDFDSYKTDVASATATLLPATVYQQASGNWESTYTTFSQNSGNYITKTMALAFSIAL